MSIFSIGLSGLNAARVGYDTVSNNVSNVYTPGYNREVMVLTGKAAGGGVRVADVPRRFDAFVARQLNGVNSKTSALDAYKTQIEQIDNLLADEDAGLAPLMQDFFASVSDLASAPSDPAARQGVIGNADILSAQFRSFDQYLSDMGQSLDGQLQSEVTQINNLTQQVAKLNERINAAQARSGEAPNRLLNQRDHLVAELSKHMDVRSHVQDDGSYFIATGKGRPLVAGTQQFDLVVMRDSANPTQMAIGYQDPSGNTLELDDSAIGGGALGGLLQFRDEALIPTRNKLGQLAAAFAMGVNAVQQQGVDLQGNAGQDMFDIGQPMAYTNADNTGSATLDVAFDPASLDALGSSDYALSYDAAGGQFEVTRVATGESFTVTPDAANQLHFGGVTVTVDNPANLADGDRFLVLPTRQAADGIQNRIADTRDIAAASAVGEPGNNENALAMEALQRQTLVGGDASFSGAYASLVSDVGSRTNIVQVNLEAQQGLSQQLTQVQQSESGVNLDEAAVNLVRYQQFYRANAKVIQTASTILDTILRLN